MVIIAEMNCLVNGLSENQKKVIGSLTGKDKLFLICDANATVSMDVLEMFMGLSVKPQFIKLDLSDKFALGYRYGVLAMTYAKEQITVISEGDYSSAFEKNMTVLKSGSKTAVKKAPVKSQSAAKEPAVKDPAPKASSPAKKTAKAVKPAAPAAPVQKPAAADKAAPVKTSSTADAARTSKIRLKDLSNDSLLRKYLGLGAYADKIKRMGEGKIKEAIEKAQDGDATFRFQLVMNFGQEDGEAIWKILKKDYSRLKALV